MGTWQKAMYVNLCMQDGDLEGLGCWLGLVQRNIGQIHAWKLHPLEARKPAEAYRINIFLAYIRKFAEYTVTDKVS